jgi:hypothetical protein
LCRCLRLVHDLVVIAAGYPALMRQFLDTNPGLRARFTRTLHFADYDAAELEQIFHGLVASAGLRWGPGTAEACREVLAALPQSPAYATPAAPAPCSSAP